MYRPPFDPAEVARTTQAAYDERHRHDKRLERRERFEPRPLVTFFCETCGKEREAQFLCPACGDVLDETAA
jgi:rubrerythrin